MAELQERMGSAEFADWMAWARIRGTFGEERADLRNGILCSLLVNVATAFSGKRGKAKATDFMPYHREPERKPATVQQQREAVEVLQQVFGRPVS